MKSAGPRIQSDAVLRLAEGRELFFESFDLFAKNETRVVAHTIEGCQHFVAKRCVLGLEIEIRNDGRGRNVHQSLSTLLQQSALAPQVSQVRKRAGNLCPADRPGEKSE